MALIEERTATVNQMRPGERAHGAPRLNETMGVLLGHRSIRAYTDEPVSDEVLGQVLDAVQAAPNWVNLQHVSIVIVRDPARRARFAELCGGQRQVAQAPAFLVFCGDFYRTRLAFDKRGQEFSGVADRLDNLIVAAHEAGIALEAAVVAAESLGLGTVPIGDVRLHGLEVVSELGLPEYVVPLLGLCVGYPAEEPDAKPRLPREAVRFEERYDPDLAAALDRYDEDYAAYLAARGANGREGTWTQLAADFYRPPYDHYPEVPQMLRQQGFFAPLACEA